MVSVISSLRISIVLYDLLIAAVITTVLNSDFEANDNTFVFHYF